MAEIYALLDPRDGDVRYIGKAKCSKARLASHLKDARRRDTPVYRWIRKLNSMGMAPSVFVLERTDDWKEAERRFIAAARHCGARLLNVAEGGDEPAMTTEQRKANGHKLANRIKTDPLFNQVWKIKRQISFALRSGHFSNKARADLREAARLNSELFGCYAELPDREEGHDGTRHSRHA